MDKRKFFAAFLKNPVEVGSVVQSSPFLVDKIVGPVNFKKAKVIIEFGAGTGVVSKRIVKKMSADCIFLCFEKDKDLCRQMEMNIKDSRVKIIADGAENLEKYLNKYEISNVDYIVSELPLAILPKPISRKVWDLCNKYLIPGGKYIQIQYSLKSKKQLKKLFPQTSIAFTPFNIPPSFVYICTK